MKAHLYGSRRSPGDNPIVTHIPDDWLPDVVFGPSGAVYVLDPGCNVLAEGAARYFLAQIYDPWARID